MNHICSLVRLSAIAVALVPTVTWAGQTPPTKLVLKDLVSERIDFDVTTTTTDTETLVCLVPNFDFRVRFHLEWYSMSQVYDWTIKLGETTVRSGTMTSANQWTVSIDDLDPYPGDPGVYTLEVTISGGTFKRQIKFVPWDWNADPDEVGNPLDDTDGDGITDLDEILWGVSSRFEADTDNDGISDLVEIQLGLNPLVADTDFDGVDDDMDDRPLVASGTVPTDPTPSQGPVITILTPLVTTL